MRDSSLRARYPLLFFEGRCSSLYGREDRKFVAVGYLGLPDTIVQSAVGGIQQSGLLLLLQIGAVQWQRLYAGLLQFQPEAEGRDTVSWGAAANGQFSVCSFYFLLNFSRIPFVPLNKFDSALELIWKGGIPLKVKDFAWRCCINRLHSKYLLLSRGIFI